MQRLQQLIDQGGPVALILLGMSVLALAIVLFKLWQFARLGVWNSSFADKAHQALEQGSPGEALEVCRRSSSPVARAMEAAIDAGNDPRMEPANTDAEVSRVGSNAVREMESGLRGLSAIAQLSPLLGLLGTVLGMIEAFIQLEDVGSQADPAVLAGGIWEALLTTAIGLAVAIPAMGAYYLLEGIVDRVKSEMRNRATSVLVYYRKERPWQPGGSTHNPSENR